VRSDDGFPSMAGGDATLGTWTMDSSEVIGEVNSNSNPTSQNASTLGVKMIGGAVLDNVNKVPSTNELLHQSSPTVSVGTIPHQRQNIINISQKELESQIFKVEAGQKFRLNGKTYVRRIISFNSRSLKGGEKNYGISKLEGLGLVWALKKNDHFLRGAPSPILIYTDHKALENFQSTSNDLMNNTLNTWLQTLNRYNFKITYVNGYQNVIPDYLSRRGEDNKGKEDKDQKIVESFYTLTELTPDRN
jgi:hypothetical protein